MTDLEHRVGKVEEKTQSLELRQVSYEEFTKANLTIMREQINETKEHMNRMEVRMDKMDERMDRLDAKVDNVSNQVHNLTVAATVGIAAIVITIILK